MNDCQAAYEDIRRYYLGGTKPTEYLRSIATKYCHEIIRSPQVVVVGVTCSVAYGTADECSDLDGGIWVSQPGPPPVEVRESLVEKLWPKAQERRFTEQRDCFVLGRHEIEFYYINVDDQPVWIADAIRSVDDKGEDSLSCTYDAWILYDPNKHFGKWRSQIDAGYTEEVQIGRLRWHFWSLALYLGILMPRQLPYPHPFQWPSNVLSAAEHITRCLYALNHRWYRDLRSSYGMVEKLPITIPGLCGTLASCIWSLRFTEAWNQLRDTAKQLLELIDRHCPEGADPRGRRMVKALAEPVVLPSKVSERRGWHEEGDQPPESWDK